MNNVAEIIRAAIAEQGAISFVRFMELALYCPLYGYYEKKEDTPGRRGDFYTSVSVGSLFGELLAFQFAEWLEAEGRNQKSEVRMAEAGAHDGRLAKDILNWLHLQRPELFELVEYCIVEPSARRQAWQAETLHEFGGKVRWVANLKTIAPRSICGVIFSNELLDALPVHRLGWDANQREWFEWGVTVANERFAWIRLPNPFHASCFTLHVLPELLAVLPDGFTTEICPTAGNWWRAAAGLLERGKLLTLDYGLAAEGFFAPNRASGTLRAYRQHRVSDDVLANAGEQDITAHVNFTAIERVGEAAGLRTEAIVPQAQILTDIARRAWHEGSGFGAWTEEHTRQFQSLTHPEHLGRAFRALIQSR